MFKNSKLVKMAGTARFKPNAVLQILIFIAVFMTISVATTVVLAVPLMKEMIDSGLFKMALDPNANPEAIYNKTMEISTSENIMLVNLFATVFEILIPIIYCRFIEKRRINSMGFSKDGFLKKYLFGYILGVVMISAAVGISALFGSLDISVSAKIPVGTIILFFIGFLIQGAAEETLCRGYFMLSLSTRTPTAVAIGISSAVFSLLHLANPGVSILALINIAMFGVFMALLILRTNSIFGACAVHSAWNFCQGNIYGIQVSGSSNTTSVLTSNPNANTFVNGGSFGLEGGIAVTIVLAVAIALVVFLPKKAPNPSEEIQSA